MWLDDPCPVQRKLAGQDNPPILAAHHRVERITAEVFHCVYCGQETSSAEKRSWGLRNAKL